MTREFRYSHEQYQILHRNSPVVNLKLYAQCNHFRQDLSQYHINGFVKERRNPIVNALQLRHSCTTPSIFLANTAQEICCFLSIKPPSETVETSLILGGRFKNTYELLNLRALKISKLHKNHIFQCMGKIFCVEFQRVPLKFHTKYLTHTLKDVDFINI